MRRTITDSSTKISTRRNSGTTIFVTTPVAPNTRSILKMLLPTTLPIAISLSFLIEATIAVANSGRLVPKAITVNPITDSDTPKLSAIFVAELTRKFAPSHKPISHPTIYSTEKETLSFLISSFSEASSSHQVFEIQNVYAKKIIKNSKKTRLSPLVTIFSDAHEKSVSKARKNNANEAIREKGTSLYIVELFAFKGYISPATQSMRRIFAIFEPITFHKASSVCHLNQERTFTKSSGAEVPNATIVKPITKEEIQKVFAILEAHVTSISAPLIRIKKPITSKI